MIYQQRSRLSGTWGLPTITQRLVPSRQSRDCNRSPSRRASEVICDPRVPHQSIALSGSAAFSAMAMAMSSISSLTLSPPPLTKAADYGLLNAGASLKFREGAIEVAAIGCNRTGAIWKSTPVETLIAGSNTGWPRCREPSHQSDRRGM